MLMECPVIHKFGRHVFNLDQRTEAMLRPNHHDLHPMIRVMVNKKIRPRCKSVDMSYGDNYALIF